MRIELAKPDWNAINKKVDAAFTCGHQVVVRSRKIKSNGDPEIREQCQRCGEQIGHAIRKITMSQAQIDALPAWDDQIGVRYCTDRNRLHAETLADEKQRLLEDWRRRYNQYLDTAEWKRKRQLVLLREQSVCEGCRVAGAKEVHHLTYDDVGEEFLFQLVALCEGCHTRWHGPPEP